MNLDIVSEIYRALELLGAEEEFLTLVGQWGNNGLDDTEIFSAMRRWNEDSAQKLRHRVKRYETSKAMAKA